MRRDVVWLIALCCFNAGMWLRGWLDSPGMAAAGERAGIAARVWLDSLGWAP